MISLLASVIPTRKRFLTDEIADVPTVFVQCILSFFLSFPFDPSKRRERTANPIALVFTTATQGDARPIAEDFCVRPALVPVAVYILCGGTTPTRTDYLDPARRTRPGMTRRGAGVRAAVKQLQAK